MAITLDPSEHESASKDSKKKHGRKQGMPELIFGDLWEYDPAPETADPQLKSRYDLFIGGSFIAPKSGKYFDSINPATEQLSPRSRSPTPATSMPRTWLHSSRTRQSWRKMPGRERGKYLYRIARLLQDRAREFAVAESIDGGKPIKESRDFDVPMAAAHFFYHAGWADKLEYVAPGRTVAPLGVVGQVIPWNFPLLMLAWKIAPALAGKLRRAQAGRDDVGHGDEVRGAVAGGGAAGWRREHRHRCGRNRRRGHGHPAAAKIAFTGSTEVGKIIMRQLAGAARA